MQIEMGGELDVGFNDFGQPPRLAAQPAE